MLNVHVLYVVLQKKQNDEVKLWRETLDGASFVNIACRPTSNQFGIVGI